jgi:hypothetical protein
MEISKVTKSSFGGEHSRRRRSDGVRRPRTGTTASFVTAVLMALILVIGPLVLGGARLWVWLPVQGLAIGLFVFQWVRLWRARREYEYKLNVADSAVVVFVLYAFVRYLTAPVEYEARLEMMNIIMYAGIYAVCRYALARTWHGLLILGAILAVACVVALFGFWLKANMDFFALWRAAAFALCASISGNIWMSESCGSVVLFGNSDSGGVLFICGEL